MSGFSKLGNKLDLSGFKAAPLGEREVTRDDERTADRVAERHGLAVEPPGRVQLNRGKSVQDRMFVQGPLSTLNRFRSYCNDQGVPLHKGLEMLLDQVER
jgi:hypothetical protein